MKRILAFPLAFGVFATPALAAAPTDQIGSTVQVVNRVTAEYEKDQRDLKQGDRVHEDEVVEVGQDAVGELKLDDETKLALGAGSRLKLDKFVYDAKKKKGDILLDLAKGSFRFVTGTAEKPTYKIKTPTASITVRGTIFDIYVQDSGMTWLLLHEGAIRVCNDKGVCRLLDKPGMLIRVTEARDVGQPVRWTSLPGRDSVGFDNAFPFVGKPPQIDPAPVLTRDIIVLGKLPEIKRPRPRDDDDDDPPPRRTPKKPKQTDNDDPPPKKRPPKRQAENDDPPPKKKPPKRADNDDPPKKKKPRNERADSGPFIPPGISIGIGIGLGKFGGGGGGRGHYPGNRGR